MLAGAPRVWVYVCARLEGSYWTRFSAIQVLRLSFIIISRSAQLHAPLSFRQTDRQVGRQAGRQADRQTDRQAGRQTGRQADRQAGRQTGSR